MDAAALAAVQHLVIVVVPAAAELLIRGDVALLQLAALVAAAHLLPVLRRSLAGLRVDGHPPHVLRAWFALVPEDLAGHRARLAADALVQVEDPGQLVLAVCAHYRCHLPTGLVLDVDGHDRAVHGYRLPVEAAGTSGGRSRPPCAATSPCRRHRPGRTTPCACRARTRCR